MELNFNKTVPIINVTWDNSQHKKIIYDSGTVILNV